MKLYRQVKGTKTVEEYAVEKVDFTKPTLIILPGAEAAIVGGSEEKSGALLKSIRFAERMLGLPEESDKLQILVAAWNANARTHDRTVQVNATPDFVSGEAKEFMRRLQSTDFNTHNTTLLGWSYGTSFMQECANEARKKGIATDKVQALSLGTLVAPEIVPKGIPGVYFYGTNDMKMEKYILAWKERVAARMNDISIHTPDDSHTYVITPVPDKMVGWMKDPESPLTIRHNHHSHMAQGYGEAQFGSFRLEDGNERIATAHVPVVQRCLRNLVGREASFSQKDLFDSSYGLAGPPTHDVMHPAQDTTTFTINLAKRGDESGPKRS